MTECRFLKRLVLLVPVILVCLFFPLFPLSSGEGAAAFEWAIPKLIKKYHIPGATMSIMKDGRLVIARGYGIADKEHKVHTTPDTLFRAIRLPAVRGHPNPRSNRFLSSQSDRPLERARTRPSGPR